MILSRNMMVQECALGEKRFYCPHCEARFAKLPQQCTFCKKMIPQLLMRQIILVEELRQKAFDAYQEGLLDQDFFQPMLKLCTDKSKSLLCDLSKRVDAEKEEISLLEEAKAGFLEIEERRVAVQMNTQKSGLSEAEKKSDGPLVEFTEKPAPEADKKSDGPLVEFTEKPAPEADKKSDGPLVELKPVVGKAEDVADRARARGNFRKKTSVAKKTAAPKFTSPAKKSKTPSWKSYLSHPAVKENLLLFLGAFLIMLGEVFLVSNAWSRMSDSMQLAGIYALISTSTLFFFFIGRFVGKRLQVTAGALILHGIALSLMPLTFAVLAHMFRYQATATIALSLATGCVYFFMCHRIGSFLSADVQSPFYFFFLPLAMAHLLVPLAYWKFPVIWGLLGYGALAFALASVEKSGINKIHKKPPTALLVWAGAMGVALVEFLLHSHYWVVVNGHAPQIFYYAPMLSLISLVLYRVNRQISPVPNSMLSLTAITLVVLGLTIATGNPYSLLATSSLALLLFTQYTREFRRREFFFAALLISLVVYFLIPYPARLFLLKLRTWLSGELGYGGEKLPYSFYALTFLPYLTGLCALGYFLQKRKEKLFESLKLWFTLISTGLLALAEFGGSDMRAPLVTLPIYAVGYLLAMRVLRFPALSYFSLAAFTVWSYALGSFCHVSDETRTIMLLAAAFLWFLGGVLPSKIGAESRAAFLDSYLITVLAASALILGGLKWPPCRQAGISSIMAGALLFPSLWIYRRQWLWFPCFSMFSAGFVFIAMCFYPGNFTAIAYALTLWAYMLTAAGGWLRVSLQKQKHLWLATRPKISTDSSQNKQLLSPLLFLIPAPVLASTVLLILDGFFSTGNSAATAVFFLLALLPLAASKILGLKREITHVSALPFVVALLPVFYTLNPGGIYVALAGSIVYAGISLYLSRHRVLALGMGGITLSFLQILRLQNIANEGILAFLAALGISWIVCRFLLKKREKIASVFEIYSLGYLAVTFTGLSVLALSGQFRSSSMFCALLFTGTFGVIHFINRRHPLLLACAFICFSGSIALCTELLFPGIYPLQSLAITLWGWTLWGIHAGFRSRFSQRDIPLQLDIYAMLSFFLAYGLGTYFSIGQCAQDIAPILGLALCALYCFTLSVERKNILLVYLFTIVANQVALSAYLRLLPSAPIYRWPLVQVLTSLALFLLASTLERIDALKNQARAIFCYVTAALALPFAWVALWRLGLLFRIFTSDRPALSLIFTAIVSTFLFLMLARKLKWRFLPYPGAVFLTTTLALDYFAATAALYPFCFASLALSYAVVALFSNERFHLVVSGHTIAFFSMALSCALYFMEKTPSPCLSFVTALLLAAYALFYFALEKRIFWAYIGVGYFLAAFYANVALQILALGDYQSPLAMLLLMAVFLAISVWCRGEQSSFRLQNNELYIDGKALSRALRDLCATVLLLLLVAGFAIWGALQDFWAGEVSSLAFFEFSCNFFQNHYLLLICEIILATGLSIFIAALERDKRIRSAISESSAVLLGSLLLLFTAPMAKLLEKRTMLGIADLDWALYGLVCCCAGFYFKRGLLSRWGGFFSLLALAGASMGFGQFSSICAVFAVALNLLTNYSFYRDRYMAKFLYTGCWTVFLLASALLANHAHQLSEPVWYFSRVPLSLLAISSLLAFFTWKAGEIRKKDLYCDWTRFSCYTTLLFLGCLAYLSFSPALPAHLIVLFCGIGISAPVLLFIGKNEHIPVAYYIMQLLGPGLYWILRFRTRTLDFLHDQELAAIFSLFALFPHAVACFVKDRRLVTAICNFSLGVALAIFVAAVMQPDFLSAALYAALAFALLSVRDALLDKDGKWGEYGIIETAGHSMALSALIACAVAYFSGKACQGLALEISGILLVASLLAYLVRGKTVYCIYLYISIALAIYAGITLDLLALDIAFHPLALLICANLVLLFAISGREHHLGKTLCFCGMRARETACHFSSVLLAGVLTFGTFVCGAMIANFGKIENLDFGRAALARSVGNHLAAICLTGIAAFGTGFHLTRYRSKKDAYWIASAIITLGLTTPLGHLLALVPAGVYCSPSVDWAVFGLVLCWFGRSHKPVCRKVSFGCLAAAVACTGLSTSSPLTFITLFVTAFHLLYSIAGMPASNRKRNVFRAHALNLLLAVYFLIFYLIPRTGKPVSLVFPLLSLVTTFMALAFPAVCQRFLEKREKQQVLEGDLRQIAIFFSLIATIFLGAAIALITRFTSGVVLQSYQVHFFLCLSSLVALALFSLKMGKNTGKTTFYYQFQALLISTYYLLRYRSQWLDFLRGYDPHVLLLFALTFYQAASILEKVSNAAARSFKNGSYLLPVAALAYLPWQLSTTGSSLFFIGAAHYGLIYLFTRKPMFLYPALIFLDLGLYRYWQTLAIVDPQFYGIPLGLSLIALGEINREQFEQKRVHALRSIGMVILYSSSAVQALIELNSPVYAFVLGVLAFAGIFIGLILSNNFYVYIASGFLLADILGYFIKYGIAHGILQGVLLVLAGIAILSAALYFHFKRQRQERK